MSFDKNMATTTNKPAKSINANILLNSVNIITIKSLLKIPTLIFNVNIAFG